MKKIFRKKIFAFFLSALLVLALSLPVFADMGPKPSVTLKLYYTPGQRYAVTLLGTAAVSWRLPSLNCRSTTFEISVPVSLAIS